MCDVHANQKSNRAASAMYIHTLHRYLLQPGLPALPLACTHILFHQAPPLPPFVHQPSARHLVPLSSVMVADPAPMKAVSGRSRARIVSQTSHIAVRARVTAHHHHHHQPLPLLLRLPCNPPFAVLFSTRENPPTHPHTHRKSTHVSGAEREGGVSGMEGTKGPSHVCRYVHILFA